MIKYLKEYRFYIILFLFLLIPISAIDTANRAPRQYRFYDRALLAVTSPIQTALSWTLEGLMGTIQNYVYLVNTRRENQTLLEENRRLLGTIADLQETHQENIRLKALLDFKETLHLESIVARVIARDVSTDFRSIRINRGESQGVKPNMAVVTAEGVVGRILRTTETTADVVILTDLLSSIESIVERSRARGMVEGKTDDMAQLRYLLRTDDVQVGDTLVSSGLGGIFPKGVPVGVVSKIEKKKYGISQDVEVRPSVNFIRLEEVLVITHQATTPEPSERKAK